MKRTLFLAGLLLAWGVVLLAQPVPNPVVSGPISATVPPGDPSHQYPFLSTGLDLASRGYVEQEFFFEGTANTYNIDPNVLKLDDATVTGSGYPYKTRMIVRRPIAAETFNGTVLLEWQNVAAGYDLDAGWLQSYEHLMRRGYAWIGVSAQRASVHTPGVGLRAWSPARYGTLDLTAGGTLANDGLQWDVFSQAAQAVRHPQGVDPMGGLPVARVLAIGASLSADRLGKYYNSIQPLAGVIDGFGVAVSGGILRTDLDVKIFKLLSETDVAGNHFNKSEAWMRQNPEQFLYDSFRRWEVAGASHIDYHFFREAAPLQLRDLGRGLSSANCQRPAFSRVPLYFAVDAMLDALTRWVQHGVTPPQGPDIEVAELGEQISVLARDLDGNALGGIRLAQHAVPTATNTGLNFPDLPPTFCRTFGSYEPFSAERLAELYPDHPTYVEQVVTITLNNLQSGFLVGPDAAQTIRETAQSEIGRR